jgi:hypothetical protein
MFVNKDQVVQTNLPARYPTPGTGHNPVLRSQEIPASTRDLTLVSANAHTPPRLSHLPPRTCARLAQPFCKMAKHCSSEKWLSNVA